MAYLKHVTDIGVARLSAGCTRLTHLNMSGFVNLSDGMQRDFALTGIQVLAVYAAEGNVYRPSKQRSNHRVERSYHDFKMYLSSLHTIAVCSPTNKMPFTLGLPHVARSSLNFPRRCRALLLARLMCDSIRSHHVASYTPGLSDSSEEDGREGGMLLVFLVRMIG